DRATPLNGNTSWMSTSVCVLIMPPSIQPVISHEQHSPHCLRFPSSRETYKQNAARLAEVPGCISHTLMIVAGSDWFVLALPWTRPTSPEKRLLFRLHAPPPPSRWKSPGDR